jgi:hypothetical protein
MSIRGKIVIECDRKGCHAEIVVAADIADVQIKKHGVSADLYADGWRLDDDERFWCPQCAEPDTRDETYERAAARARNNDFADTGGKDWT